MIAGAVQASNSGTAAFGSFFPPEPSDHTGPPACGGGRAGCSTAGPSPFHLIGVSNGTNYNIIACYGQPSPNGEMLASQSGIGGAGAARSCTCTCTCISRQHRKNKEAIRSDSSLPSFLGLFGQPAFVVRWTICNSHSLGQDARMLYNIGATPLAVACHSELSANRFNYLA